MSDGQDTPVVTNPGTNPDTLRLNQGQNGDAVVTAAPDQPDTDGDTTTPIVDLSQRDTNTVVTTPPAPADTTAGGRVNTATVDDQGNILFSPTTAPLEATVTTTTTVPAQPATDGTPTATDGTTPPVPAPGSEFEGQYNQLGDKTKVQLSPEAEKAIADQLAEFKKKLDDNNYEFGFKKGEGPWNSMTRLRNEAVAQQKAGQELTPQQKALLGLSEHEVVTEAIRIRDRDFKVFKDDKGNPRNWYTTKETTSRWNQQEIADMMKAQEAQLRTAAEAKVREAEAQAREAAAEAQRQLAAKIEKNVPPEAMIQQAATTAQLDINPAQVRENMKAHVAKEVADGTLPLDALDKPVPRVGAAFVGTGVLNAEDLKQSLTKLGEMKNATKQGDPQPQLIDAVKAVITAQGGDPAAMAERIARAEKTNSFYTELKKLAEAAATAPPRDPLATAAENPFDPSLNELKTPVTTVPDTSGSVVPGTDATTTTPTPADTTTTVPTPADTTTAVPRTDVQPEVTERAGTTPGVVTDLKQMPSPYLALTAFKAAGLDSREWVAAEGNNAQQALIDGLKSQQLRGELGNLPPGILEGTASIGTVDPVNKFLSDKGMNITLDPIGENDVAFAATLGVKGQWAGRATEIATGNNTKVPGVNLRGIQSYQVGDQTVVRLYEGADGIEVFAAPMEQDMAGEEVLARATALTPKADTQRGEYTAVNIPMVNMDARSDLPQLVGMRAASGETITQAKMQTKIALDENGFSVEQGLAAASTRSIDNAYTFDKPFVLWVRHKGSSQPLAAVRVDQRFWQDPKQAK